MTCDVSHDVVAAVAAVLCVCVCVCVCWFTVVDCNIVASVVDLCTFIFSILYCTVLVS